MAASWRLLSGSPSPAADEMALDMALLKAANQPALRLWRLSEPATLTGANDLPGKPGSVRRPTGGGTFATDTLAAGWSVVVPTTEDPVGVVDKVTRAIAAAYGGGVEFTSPDLFEQGGKRVGWAGGAGSGRCVLVQGVFYAVPGGFADALKKAVLQVVPGEVTEGELSPEEEEAAMEPVPARPSPPQGPSGDLPTAAGTVRATIVPQPGLKQIKEAYFSGSFNAYPWGLLESLQKAVAGVTIQSAPTLFEEFFTKNPGRVAGVQPGEFFTALSLAFMKVRLAASAAPDPDAWKKEKV